MQEVYKNGMTGEAIKFELDKLKKSLENPEVDHVKVFDKEKGNKLCAGCNKRKRLYRKRK